MHARILQHHVKPIRPNRDQPPIHKVDLRQRQPSLLLVLKEHNINKERRSLAPEDILQERDKVENVEVDELGNKKEANERILHNVNRPTRLPRSIVNTNPLNLPLPLPNQPTDLTQDETPHNSKVVTYDSCQSLDAIY